jgi:hypothetical protein
MHSNTPALNVISWIVGIVFSAIGLINTFWGNDPAFGIFVILLSAVYYPPVTTIVKTTTGLSVPWMVKILLGMFILWAALGVGELFDKIDLMLRSF